MSETYDIVIRKMPQWAQIKAKTVKGQNWLVQNMGLKYKYLIQSEFAEDYAATLKEHGLTVDIV